MFPTRKQKWVVGIGGLFLNVNCVYFPNAVNRMLATCHDPHSSPLSSGISLPLACLQPLWPPQIDLPANMLISFSSFNLIVLGTESKSSDLPFCGLDAAQLLVISPLLIPASNLNQTIQAISHFWPFAYTISSAWKSTLARRAWIAFAFPGSLFF